MTLIGTGKAAVWVLEVPRSAKSAFLDLSVLDQEERSRMAAFCKEEDQVRFGSAHAALRGVLGVLTGMAPHTLQFARDACPVCAEPHGRPVVAGAQVFPEFSLSYDRGLVLMAAAANRVGVDVEQVPDDASVVELTPLLHPKEREAVEAAPAEDRAAVFARVWARKEAYLKALGVGLGRDLAWDNMLSRIPGWHIIDLPLGPAYAGAVAVRSRDGGQAIRVDLWDAEAWLIGGSTHPGLAGHDASS